MLLKQKNVKQDDVQVIFSQLEIMKVEYKSNTEMAIQIDRINYNLNFLLLNKVFIDKPKEKFEDAINSIEQIKSFYEKNNIIDAQKILLLGKTAVYYNDIPYALDLMSDFMDDDDIMAYNILLAYQYPLEYGGEMFVESLLKAKENMSEKNWCAMFMRNCGIPFQIFDNEEVYNAFCKECIDKNERIKALMNYEMKKQ